MKTCTRCGTRKPVDDFNRSSRNRDGRHAYCRDCQKAHYRANKLRHGRNVRRAERERRARYRAYIAPILAMGCVDCGNADIRVLDFDHVRGVKVDNVTAMLKDASFANIRTEIAKCELRCKNCHAIVTYRRRGGTWHDEYQPQD